MAAVKAKKPTTKLKAGKKKQTNKWLILGGVAAVAIIGAVVVRFSSASTWRDVGQRDTWQNTLSRVGQSDSSLAITLKSGRNYRYCVTGYSKGSSSTTKIAFKTESPSLKYGVASSTKKYGRGNEFHCSATFRTTKTYKAAGNIELAGGSSFVIKSRIIQELR